MRYAPSFVTDVSARVAPNTMKKSGPLSMDGVARWATLEGGRLRIFSDLSGTGNPHVDVSMLYVEVVANNATRATMRLAPVAPCELRVTIEPEAVNRAIDEGRATAPGAGVLLGGCLNAAPRTEQHTGTVSRRTISLTADSPAEKYAWAHILTATADGRRCWAHVKHEASITANAVRGSVRRQP